MDELVLYQFMMSPYCIKIRRILDYKRLVYRTVEVNPFARGGVAALRGQKRLPVVIARAWANRTGIGAADGTRRTVVSDSTRIAAYLEERCPDPPIFPGE